MSEALVKKTEGEERQLQYMGNVSTVPGSYEPENLKAATDLCQVLCTGGLVPKDLQNKPGDVLTLIATGREYGLGWPAALQNLYVVHGRIGSYAEFQRARIMQHPDCEMFELVEASRERAAFKVKKRTMDEPAIVEFTVEDAIDAQLMKRLDNGKVVGMKGPDSNWSKYTSDMLVARATTRAKRRYFPYVLTDLAAVEELRDLPPEKNITPRAELADERAQTIASAAGRNRNKPLEDLLEKAEVPPEANVAPRLPEDEPEEAPEPERKALEPEEPIQRIQSHLRRQMLELDGIGPKVLEALEEAGLSTARHIWQAGVSGLSKTPGIGGSKAKTLHGWANGVVDEDLRRQATAPKEEDSAEEEDAPPEAKEPRHFRSRDYVVRLVELADKHGVTKAQLRKKTDELAASVGLPAGIDAEALPDPEWVTLQQWVQSAEQPSLPIENEAAEKPEGVISEKRAGIIVSALRRIAEHFGEDGDAAEAWEAEFYLFLKEGWGINNIRDLPEDAYGAVLAYMTEHDPR